MRKLTMPELNRLSLTEYQEVEKLDVIIVLDNVRSLSNIGSFFRTADAFRIGEIFLCGITACPPHREIHKTALGAEESVKWRHFESTEDACKYRQELTSTGDVITAVSQNPGAIGYASLASVKNTVKAVSIDGVVPSEETIKDGSYVVQRPFVLVTKTDAVLSEGAQKFFDYITSDEAVEIISSAGVVAAK